MLTKLINTKLFNTIYSAAVLHVEARRAQANRRRSERDLQKLDDRLLDDIGLLRREDGSIVPTTARIKAQNTEECEHAPSFGETLAEQARSHTRCLRHPYLIRRRR